MRRLNKRIIFSLSILATTIFTAQANAGGFQLYEQDAADLGEYHAGMAAKADDASTEFYNPAGMVRLKHTSISSGLTAIALSTYFKGKTGPKIPEQWEAFGKGDTTNYVPNLHLVVPFKYKGYQAAFGFGVNVPYGLATHYPNSGIISQIGYAATETKLMAINIGPSLALAITPKISVGGGVDFMFGQATYNGEAEEKAGIGPVVLGSYSNQLEGAGWGFNLGGLWQPTNRVRFGVAYRSPVWISAHGPSVFKSLLVHKRSTASATVAIPGSITVSGFDQINSKWSVEATAMYTQWDLFKSLTINGMAIPDNSTADVKYNYKNTWMEAIGTKYWITDRNAISFGYGLDSTPTQNGHRDIRLPDGNRWIASTGWEYRFNCNSSVDFGYAYVDMGNADINNSKNGGKPYVKGTSSGHANIVGIQLNYSFA